MRKKGRVEPELRDNFAAMLPGDTLLWDVTHVRSVTELIRRDAKAMGWKISIKCEPPMKAAYVIAPGRLTIKREENDDEQKIIQTLTNAGVSSNRIE